MDAAKKPSRLHADLSGLLKFAAKLLLVLFLVNAIVMLSTLIAVSARIGLHIDDVAAMLPDLGNMFVVSLVELAQMSLPFLLVLALEIVAHELGHVVGGRLAGFRFVLLVLGPLRVSGEAGGLKFERAGEGDPQPGAALSVPTDTHNLRTRTAIAVAGGPLASLLLGLASAAMLQLFSGGPYWLMFLFQMSALVSLISGFINLLPLKAGGMLSDGARLKMLLTGGAASERYCLITALSGVSRTGLRPREWDQTWMRRINELSDGSLDDAAASHISFYWFLDLGDVDGGEHTLERLLSSINAVPAPLHPLLYMEAAFFYAYYRRDPHKARAFLEKVGDKSNGRHYHMQARAEAAVLALEGQEEEARKKAASGLAHMEREKTRGPGWELDYEWLKALAAPAVAG